jgi:hypothetical protein
LSVNIVDTESITEYLREQAAGDAQLATWLKIALAKSLRKRAENAAPLDRPPPDAAAWLREKWTSGEPLYRFAPDAALNDQVGHIKDWLASARQTDAEFLRETDERGRPRKLLNLDLARATKHADRYFARLNQTFRNAVEETDDTRTVMRFEGGSRIAELLTPAALRYEGPNMGHCIAGGSYDESLLDGSCHYYSLRDAANKPHATFQVEVAGNTLLQCKGKENVPPVQKYMPQVQAFVTERQFELRERPRYTGLVKDQEGRYHSIYQLPDHLTVRGCLDLGGTAITQLPDHLTVGGGLFLRGTAISRLPDHLTVGGDLDLRGTAISRLPDHLTVGGSLYFGGSAITQLPDHLTVGGDLDLRGSAITQLPDHLTVGSCLFLMRCPGLTSIPDSVRAQSLHTDYGIFPNAASAAIQFKKIHARLASPKPPSPV